MKTLREQYILPTQLMRINRYQLAAREIPSLFDEVHGFGESSYFYTTMRLVSRLVHYLPEVPNQVFLASISLP